MANLFQQIRDIDNLVAAAKNAVVGLEQLSKEEANRRDSTFELCDYTFTKRLRDALKRVAEWDNG